MSGDARGLSKAQWVRRFVAALEGSLGDLGDEVAREVAGVEWELDASRVPEQVAGTYLRPPDPLPSGSSTA